MVLERVRKLGEEETRYEFFSGKGGVGKTTLSVARALYLANRDEKVLIISTDPAHSLSDSFEMEVKPEETRLKDNLYGVEISPEKAMEDFQEKVSEEDMGMMGGMADFGEEMEGMGDLSSMTPGIDEMAAFDKFIQYMHKEEYDYIIFDTAPTGHTLRFLSLPDVMESWVGKLLRVKRRISEFTGMFKGVMPFTQEEDTKEESGEALEALKEKIKEGRELMQDSERTTFWLVMIPEEMSLYEGRRMLEELSEYNIDCEKVIVNKLVPENQECEFCSAKREQQLEVLDSIEKEFKGKDIRTFELQKEEIKGFKLLKRVGEELYQ